VIRRRFVRWLGLLAWLPSVTAGAAGCSHGAEDPPGGRRVLFLGNSLTATNNLPGMVQALAQAAGLPAIQVGSLTRGGANLDDLWSVPDVPTSIAEGHWEVVVLQQGPSSLPESRVQLRAATHRYAEEIRRAGGRPALYMVWPAAGWAGDFDAVSASYTLAAHDVDGILFPVGEAFRLARQIDPSVELFSADGFHPSVAGSYLAALVIVGRLYDRSPVGLPAQFTVDGRAAVSVPGHLAGVLQTAAEQANERFTRR